MDSLRDAGSERFDEKPRCVPGTRWRPCRRNWPAEGVTHRAEALETRRPAEVVCAGRSRRRRRLQDRREVYAHPGTSRTVVVHGTKRARASACGLAIICASRRSPSTTRFLCRELAQFDPAFYFHRTKTMRQDRYRDDLGTEPGDGEAERCSCQQREHNAQRSVAGDPDTENHAAAVAAAIPAQAGEGSNGSAK